MAGEFRPGRKHGPLWLDVQVALDVREILARFVEPGLVVLRRGRRARVVDDAQRQVSLSRVLDDRLQALLPVGPRPVDVYKQIGDRFTRCLLYSCTPGAVVGLPV